MHFYNISILFPGLLNDGRSLNWILLMGWHRLFMERLNGSFGESFSLSCFSTRYDGFGIFLIFFVFTEFLYFFFSQLCRFVRLIRFRFSWSSSWDDPDTTNLIYIEACIKQFLSKLTFWAGGCPPFKFSTSTSAIATLIATEGICNYIEKTYTIVV